MHGGGFYLTDKDGVVPMGDLTHELAFHGANRVGEDRQTQGPPRLNGAASKRPPTPFWGLKKTAARSF